MRALLSLLILGCPLCGIAQADPPAAGEVAFKIEPQAMPEALNQFAHQSGYQLLFQSEVARDLLAPRIEGTLKPEAALKQLLANSGLSYRFINEHTITIRVIDAAQSSRWDALAAEQLRLARSADAQLAEGSAAKDPATPPREEESNQTVQEVVVTAQKRAQALKDVPMSVVAISGAELERRGINSTVDIALSVPGVSVQDRGGANTRYIFLRGLGNQRGSQTMVGVYLDEQDVTGFPYYALDLRSFDLERLEVLRGPQGTLYGSGAMGGVLRYITKNVDLTSRSGDAYLRAAVTEDGDPSETLGGSVNLPLVTDALGVRVAGFYENDGGWMDQPALSKSNINDERLYSFRIKGLWTPTESMRISALVMSHRNDTGAPNVGEDSDGNYVQQFGRATTPSGENNYDIYNLTATYSADRFQVLSSSGYFDQENAFSEFSYVNQALPPTPPTPILAPNDRIVTRSFVQELRISSLNSKVFNWTFGGSYREAAQLNSGLFLVGVGSSVVNLVDTVYATSKAVAVFGEGNVSLGERLTLGAGVRYYEDKQRNIPTGQSGTFDQVSPRVTATFSATRDINLYANIAKGFRSGGFNTPSAIARGASPDFQPDYVSSYELGGKGALGSRLSFDLAGFYSEYKDAQNTGIVTIGGVPVTVTGNLGDAVIKGIDWDLGLKITRDFSIGTGGEYLHGRYTRIDPNARNVSAAVGDRLTQVPDYHYNVWLKHDLHRWLGGERGFVQIDYNKQGPMFIGTQVAGALFGRSDIIDMLNASIGWERANWTVSLFGRNLLNDRGSIDAQTINSLSARSRPRTYGVNVRLSFD